MKCPKYDPDYKKKQAKKEYHSKETKEAKKKEAKKETRNEDQDSDDTLIVESTIDEANFSISNGTWVLDTGASRHMTFDRADFTSYQELDQERIVRFGGNQKGHGVGIWVVKLVTIVNNQVKRINLKDVLHVPELRRKVISISNALDNGSKGIIMNQTIELYNKTGDLIMIGHKVNKIYLVDTVEEDEVNVTDDSASVWH